MLYCRGARFNVVVPWSAGPERNRYEGHQHGSRSRSGPSLPQKFEHRFHGQPGAGADHFAFGRFVQIVRSPVQDIAIES
jgi:hypothetical protein